MSKETHLVIPALQVWMPVSPAPPFYITLVARTRPGIRRVFEFRVAGGDPVTATISGKRKTVRIPMYTSTLSEGDLQVRNMDSCDDIIISDIELEETQQKGLDHG